jgi:hypothetical protein
MTDNQPGKPDGRPLMREDVLRAQAEIDRPIPLDRSVPPTKTRTVIAALQDIAARDRDDYAQLIESLRRFAQQKRADLEAFEKLMGTK